MVKRFHGSRRFIFTGSWSTSLKELNKVERHEINTMIKNTETIGQGGEYLTTFVPGLPTKLIPGLSDLICEERLKECGLTTRCEGP